MTSDALSELDVARDPVAQFRRWFAEAGDAGERLPETVVLATATPDGVPSARAVLLKGVDERGFVIFTNQESRKGRELDANPRAALVFLWPTLGRQVRVEGTVERVGREEVDAYFATRPRGSQVGAWASPQSTVIPDRAALEALVAETERRFGEGRDRVPAPPFWGGYRVRPEAVEFWQHRDDRLHDRIRYRRERGGWLLERLAP
jgi:pyridoxamine 5'-phosphate oxidase